MNTLAGSQSESICHQTGQTTTMVLLCTLQSRAPSLTTSELQEKYKQVMVTNAQLDNDKQKLMYEVDLLKDQLADSHEYTIELESQLAHTSRVCRLVITASAIVCHC